MNPAISGPDAAARHRIRYSLTESLLVEASAGTGKTTELVRRITAILETGHATVGRIAAVTFTHKAAGELKLRLRLEIDQRLRDTSNASLEHALTHLEEASIGTIHGFCAQILRERPVEARVDPAFTEVDQSQQDKLYEKAFRTWLQQCLNEDSPAVRRALLRPSPSWASSSAADSLRYSGRQLLEWRDYNGDWTLPEWDRSLAIQELIEGIRTIPENILRRSNNKPLINFLQWLAHREALKNNQNDDFLEAQLLQLQLDSGRLQNLKDLQFHLSRFKDRSDADLAARLRLEMLSLIDLYEQLKRKSGSVDFLDLLIRARDLVRDHPSVLAHLRKRFTHLFIDEFQDTDPLQAELLLQLANPHQLFIVGDPKQSIYKFRRADIVFYNQVRKRLEADGVGIVQLSRSFRSVAPIQHFVNRAFQHHMNGDERSGQAVYVALESGEREAIDQPAVIGLPIPNPYGYRGGITKSAINESLPEAVANYVDWLIRESGWKVRNPRDTQWCDIREEHICILFRRFTHMSKDMSRDYVHGLEARNITHVLVGAKSFHDREEIITLRAALMAIEWPDDELSVFACLKGSLFAITDALLLQYRTEHGRLHPLKIPEETVPALTSIKEALQLIRTLHFSRNQNPVATTINTLLETVRAFASFALRPAGHQVLANVNRVLDLARQHEINGGLSFRGFVEELNRQAENPESSESPVLEEGAAGVRIMTVHQAKGLEFPVVILADVTANLARQKAERYIDTQRRLCAIPLAHCSPLDLSDHQPEEVERERAEGIRVAYVAATRARDLLVIPAVRGEEVGGWLGPLEQAVQQEGIQWADARLLQRKVPGLHGLKDEDFLADSERAQQGIDRYRSWQQQRKNHLEQRPPASIQPILPSLDTITPPEDCPIDVIHLDRMGNRPRGRRFGSLVHAVLNDERTNLHVRLLGATPEEKAEASDILNRVKAHPIFTGQQKILREVPITCPLDSGEILDGVIDLAMFDGSQWTIIDYKTDQADQTRYIRQLQWYVWAMRKMTGKPVRGVLLAV